MEVSREGLGIGVESWNRREEARVGQREKGSGEITGLGDGLSLGPHKIFKRQICVLL